VSKLSVVIPSRNEPYLARTIQSIFDNARGEIEVVVHLDGYWPADWQQTTDRYPNLHTIHSGESIGMRGGINKAVASARSRGAKYIAKFDGQASDYSKRVDAYNARCGGSTPLPQDKYRACLAEKGDLAGRKIELDREKEVLDGEYRAIDGEYKPRSGRLESIRKEMADDAQAFAKVEKDYKAVFDRIEAVKKRLVEMCAAGDQARDPFAVRLCVGAGWDGQKKEFAGLTDLPPPAP